MNAPSPHHPRRGHLAGRGYFKRLGPGIVTGAADDDPSGIGTYSQTGAAFGYQLVWTTLLALPFAVAVQEATARLGLYSGKGLAELIKIHFKRWVLFVALVLVVGANTFNIGADLGSMAAATNLVVPVPEVLLLLVFGFGIAALEIAIPYHRYARILRWLCLSLLSYLIVLFIVKVTWSDVAAATLHTEGVTTIGTADEAAQALEPLAGRLAGLVFTLGIVGTGLLAVPVLAGSTSYAIAETFGWREGLSLKMSQARAFYGVIVASMLAGIAMNLFGLDPVRGLYWSAVLNGVAAPPLIVMIFLLARKRSLLGAHASGPLSQVVVALAALLSATLPILFLFAR